MENLTPPATAKSTAPANREKVPRRHSVKRGTDRSQRQKYRRTVAAQNHSSRQQSRQDAPHRRTLPAFSFSPLCQLPELHHLPTFRQVHAVPICCTLGTSAAPMTCPACLIRCTAGTRPPCLRSCPGHSARLPTAASATAHTRQPAAGRLPDAAPRGREVLRARPRLLAGPTAQKFARF